MYTGPGVPPSLTLVRFSKRRIGELFGARAARLYGIGIAVSFAILIGILPRPVSPSTLEDLLVSALKSASWAVAGFSALSAARDLVGRDREDGVLSLLAQRGFDPRTLELSRALGAAFLIATWIAVPAALLALLAWAKLGEPDHWPWVFAWIGFVVAYSVVLGIVAGGLARAVSLVTERGRLALVGLVIAPELLRVVWPSVPSIPGLFSWALERASEFDSMLLRSVGG